MEKKETSHEADLTEKEISGFSKRRNHSESAQKNGTFTFPTSLHLLADIQNFPSSQRICIVEDSRLRQLVAFCFLSLLVKGKFK
jgi:hypothetical protein